RVIGLADGELAFGRTDALPLSELDDRLEDTKDGDLVETCTPAQTIMAHIGAMIGAHGGTALIIDYGDWRSLGDTFQALQAQKKVSPLDNPGNADLTAHVDFEALVKTCAPAVHSRLTPQGVFLERLGITPRAQALAAKLSGDALETHIAAHRRLTHPDEMGLLFKVIGITPDASTTPPGLEP
ncbi:MAG: SAM-dependent methyltransferase, partial [Pseudomonadota bacterium]|nr:SAM-dependent methyltransferase [Pseudomonadota bacterium]